MGCATLRHNVRSIAREASAAPAAKFKSPYRTSSLRDQADFSDNRVYQALASALAAIIAENWVSSNTVATFTSTIPSWVLSCTTNS